MRLFAFFFAASCFGATVTLTPGSTILANPLQLGVLNGSADNYGPGQFTKNWLAAVNPSFQGVIARQTVPIVSGTTSSFTGYNVYDLAPTNAWTNATFLGMVSPAGDLFPGETGTISGNNTVVEGTTGITYTLGSTLAHAPQFGDYASIAQEIDSTPGAGTAGTSALCTASGSSLNNCVPGNWFGSLNGNAIITTETGDLPSGTYDLQALVVDTTASGASAIIDASMDAGYTGKGGNYLAMWNGTSYTISIKCKTVSGTSPATVTMQVVRSATGGQNSQGTASCTNSWSTISYTFTGAETSSTTVGTMAAYFKFPQGTKFEVTDAFLGQTTTSGSNYTEYLDTYVAAMQALAPGTLRLWDGQNGIVGDSFDDAIKPIWGRHYGSWVQGNTYWTGVLPQSGYYDHLSLCQIVGVSVCTMVIPASWSTADYQHLIQFIAGTSGTYPSKRAALDALSGRPTGAFSSAITTIVLELTDEPWNGSFDGENMPYLNGSPAYYQKAYGLWASSVFTAMKADSTYVSNIKVAINCQTGGLGAYASCLSDSPNVLTQVSNADYILIAQYYGSANLTTIDTLQDEFNPQSGFGYSNANDTTNGWVANWNSNLQSLWSSYGAKIGIYEGGYGTLTGTVTAAQIAANNAAMIEGAEIVQGYMETMKTIGATDQSIFAATQDYYNYPNPIWGIMKDPDGGQLAGQGNYYFRQAGVATQIANQCIGQNTAMYQAVVSSETTYSTSALNGWPAWTNLPYMTAYAFSGGTAGGLSSSTNNRCLLLVNVNPANTESVMLAGTAPSTVSTVTLTGSNCLTSTNETSTPGVTIVRSSGVSVSGGYTMPACSVSALIWNTSPSAAQGSIFSGIMCGGCLP